MTKAKKELIIFEYKEIVSIWKCNISERNIGKVLNYSQNTIHDVISIYKNSGYKVLFSKTGKPKLIIERDSYHLIKIFKEDRKVNL